MNLLRKGNSTSDILKHSYEVSDVGLTTHSSRPLNSVPFIVDLSLLRRMQFAQRGLIRVLCAKLVLKNRRRFSQDYPGVSGIIVPDLTRLRTRLDLYRLTFGFSIKSWREITSYSCMSLTVMMTIKSASPVTS